jgi:membrane-associated phospholipid phosphatase
MAHHRRARFAFAMLVAITGGPLRAQARLGSERRDIETFTGDIWSVWTSPARLSTQDVAPVAIAAAAITLTTRIDSATRVWMLAHGHSPLLRVFAPLRDSAKIHAGSLGTGMYLLPLSGALYVAGRLSHSSGLRDAGLGCGAGHLGTLGIREIAYHAIGRARPRVTDDPFELSIPGSTDWLWHSFFSGHIANSMACASFLSHRYSFGIGEVVPYAYATAIGVGRMADAEHWASDTVLGAVVGYAIGRAIAARQLTRMSTVLATGGTASPRRLSPRVPLLSWTYQF